MTRETKVGLLFGVAVVMLIGIILADHVATSKNQPSADAQLQQSAQRAGEGTSMTRRGAPRGSLTNRGLVRDNLGLRRESTTPAPSNELDTRRSNPTPTTTNSRPNFVRALAADRNENKPQQQPAQNTTTPTTRSQTASRTSDLLRRAASTNTTTQTTRPAPTNSTSPAVQQPTAMTDYQRRVLAAQNRATGQNATNTTTLRGTTIFDRNQPNGSATGTRAMLQPPAVNTGNRSNRIHVVKPNETLFGLAVKYYGDGDKWNLIQKANPKIVKANGTVYAGAKLTIPYEPKTINSLQTADNAAPVGSLTSTRRTTTEKTITVASGDTLSEISQKYLGSAKHWKEILAANNMKSANELRAGMKLKLPTLTSSPAATTTAQTQATSTPRSTSAANSETYTVKGGDSLIRIAKRELGDGGRWREIYELNKKDLSSPDAVKVGQKLKLPKK